MQLNFVVRQGNSAITLSFVNPSPMGEGFQLLETLLQLHKLCSYIICSIKYTCTIYQFTQKIPHTLSYQIYCHQEERALYPKWSLNYYNLNLTILIEFYTIHVKQSSESVII